MASQSPERFIDLFLRQLLYFQARASGSLSDALLLTPGRQMWLHTTVAVVLLALAKALPCQSLCETVTQVSDGWEGIVGDVESECWDGLKRRGAWWGTFRDS